MGQACAKEEEANRGISNNTAGEIEATDIIRLQSIMDSEKNLAAIAIPENKELDEPPQPQKTKALRGKALLMACLVDDDDDFGEVPPLPKDGEFDSMLELPGMLFDSPCGTERSKNGSRTTTPNGTGRKSRKFKVKEDKDSGYKSKALKGKALLAACILDDDFDDM